MMKRILISAVLALALAGTTAFAAQNKNAPKKSTAKPAASATSNAGTMKSSGKKRHHKKRHKKGHKKADSDSGGGMTRKGKTNKNK